MARAIGLLILLAALELAFGDLHISEFLAKQVAPPVHRLPANPSDGKRPSPALNGVSAENPLLKDPQGNINRQMFDLLPEIPAKNSPGRK